MALPTLVKDYEINANNTVTGDATIDAGTNAHRDRRNLILNIKNALVVAGTSDIGPSPGGGITAWSHVQSSNATTTSTVPGTDLWAALADINWDTGGNTHSWIVLQQTGIAANFQVCFDLVQGNNSDDGGEMTVVVSESGFATDGTTSARPTATDELVLRNLEVWGSGAQNGGAKTFIWHMWRTEDGEVTHVVIHYNDVTLGFWTFCVPQNPSASWDGVPFVAAVQQGLNDDVTSATKIEDFYDTTNIYTYRANRISTANSLNRTNIYFTADTFGSGPFVQELTVANQVTGEYALGDIGLVCLQSNFVGKMGTMFDLYWGQDPLGKPADTYPSGGSKTWVQFQDIVFPWDGATPVTT